MEVELLEVHDDERIEVDQAGANERYPVSVAIVPPSAALNKEASADTYGPTLEMSMRMSREKAAELALVLIKEAVSRG